MFLKRVLPWLPLIFCILFLSCQKTEQKKGPEADANPGSKTFPQFQTENPAVFYRFLKKTVEEKNIQSFAQLLPEELSWYRWYDKNGNSLSYEKNDILRNTDFDFLKEILKKASYEVDESDEFLDTLLIPSRSKLKFNDYYILAYRSTSPYEDVVRYRFWYIASIRKFEDGFHEFSEYWNAFEKAVKNKDLEMLEGKLHLNEFKRLSEVAYVLNLCREIEEDPDHPRNSEQKEADELKCAWLGLSVLTSKGSQQDKEIRLKSDRTNYVLFFIYSADRGWAAKYFVTEEKEER